MNPLPAARHPEFFTQSRIRRILFPRIRIFIDFLFPIKCLVCGRFFRANDDWYFGGKGWPREFILYEPLDAVFHKLMSHLLCPVCVSGFSAIETPLCRACGIMFRSEKGVDHLCPM
ncbi:MAG: hypothetical protein AB1659_04665, partial [Thermodesulfobacteriota bacterium]